MDTMQTSRDTAKTIREDDDDDGDDDDEGDDEDNRVENIVGFLSDNSQTVNNENSVWSFQRSFSNHNTLKTKTDEQL